MDSIKLQTFLTVAKEHSMSKAAEQLYISTAAVKKQIDALEHETQLKLFERTSSGCHLTSAGQSFQRGVLQLLKQSEEIVQAARKVQQEEGNGCTMGYSIKLNYALLSKVTALYHTSFNENALHFVRMQKGELLPALSKGMLDCFLYVNPQTEVFEGIEASSVGTTCIHCVVKSNHPLAHKTLITLEDCIPYPIYISSVIGNAVKEDLQKVSDNTVQILDRISRNEILSNVENETIVLFPCASEYGVSIPFLYRPLMVNLYYKTKTTQITTLIDAFKECIALPQTYIL